ncbi:hypothetical protein GW17_00051397 [Ensete ventricosum]|nr:hypothetical protein GW17_00051397 [Ensete ventricosum]
MSESRQLRGRILGSAGDQIRNGWWQLFPPHRLVDDDFAYVEANLTLHHLPRSRGPDRCRHTCSRDAVVCPVVCFLGELGMTCHVRVTPICVAQEDPCRCGHRSELTCVTYLISDWRLLWSPREGSKMHRIQTSIPRGIHVNETGNEKQGGEDGSRTMSSPYPSSKKGLLPRTLKDRLRCDHLRGGGGRELVDGGTQLFPPPPPRFAAGASLPHEHTHGQLRE